MTDEEDTARMREREQQQRRDSIPWRESIARNIRAVLSSRAKAQTSERKDDACEEHVELARGGDEDQDDSGDFLADEQHRLPPVVSPSPVEPHGTSERTVSVEEKNKEEEEAQVVVRAEPASVENSVYTTPSVGKLYGGENVTLEDIHKHMRNAPYHSPKSSAFFYFLLILTLAVLTYVVVTYEPFDDEAHRENTPNVNPPQRNTTGLWDGF